MDERCKEYKILVTRTGTYHLEAMPFGLMNAPSTFHWMMDAVLKNVKFAPWRCDWALKDHGGTHNLIAKRFYRDERASTKVKNIRMRIRQKQVRAPQSYSKLRRYSSWPKESGSYTRRSVSVWPDLVSTFSGACRLLQNIHRNICKDIRSTLPCHIEDRKLLLERWKATGFWRIKNEAR